MKTWDIFCRVIDNYGDIGVCWRLARQLAAEYPVKVQLWVDELLALQAICPEAELIDNQLIQDVWVRQWPSVFPADTACADVVIEAFACALPESYIANMLEQKRRGQFTQWFNLEYLSAEDWVEGCHGLNAIQPQTGLSKTWFFPGFSTKTGGLLRETQLDQQRQDFIDDSAGLQAWRNKLTGLITPPEALWISLFAYENPAVGSLLEAWQVSPVPVICLVPQGRIFSSIQAHLSKQQLPSQPTLTQGANLALGNLHLVPIPFMAQLQYDQLLWACDLNFVRGEDSFVRAQWAAKPLIWHIYPQEDGAHFDKLDAFLAKYTTAAKPELGGALRTSNRQWNQGEDCTAAWEVLLKERQNWAEHSQNWTLYLKSLGNLASNMVHFYQKTL